MEWSTKMTDLIALNYQDKWQLKTSLLDKSSVEEMVVFINNLNSYELLHYYSMIYDDHDFYGQDGYNSTSQDVEKKKFYSNYSGSPSVESAEKYKTISIEKIKWLVLEGFIKIKNSEFEW